jgi:hypothetical protein
VVPLAAQHEIVAGMVGLVEVVEARRLGPAARPWQCSRFAVVRRAGRIAGCMQRPTALQTVQAPFGPVLVTCGYACGCDRGPRAIPHMSHASRTGTQRVGLSACEGGLTSPSSSLASSSRSQVPGQAARAVARLTSGVVSTVVHQRPWLVVVEVTHLVTRHQPDQPVAGPCHGRGCSVGRRRSALATAGRSRVRRP